MGLALGKNLTFYNSVAKGLKLKARRFWEIIPAFVEVTKEKLVVGRGRGGGKRVNTLPLSDRTISETNLATQKFISCSYRITIKCNANSEVLQLRFIW